jgi:transcriptional regulator with XRE-family HTH domain
MEKKSPIFYHANWKIRKPMDLKTYLELKNINVKDFAEIVGVNSATISRYINWQRKPDIVIANRIVKATKGKVTHQDLAAYWEAKKDHG